MDRPNLALLLGSYFHQDHLEITGDEASTVHAFCVENPRRVKLLVDDIEGLLADNPSDDQLATFANDASCDIDPRLTGESYREWFASIAAQARTYAAEHPQSSTSP